MTVSINDIEVVLLDDDTFHLKILSHHLNSLGYNNINAFDDGHMALGKLQEESMVNALVIMDLNMPGMDGIEFLVALKDVPFDGHIILLSGEDMRVLESARSVARAYALTVLDHIQKPVEASMLETTLNKITSTRKKTTLGKSSAKNLITVESLKKALKNREFFNVYQPKVDLQSGQVASVEALVRWANPDGNTIYPDQFIGLVEEYGLIDELLWNVLEEALEDRQKWKRLGMEMKVAVNISMDNLSSRDFISSVEAALNKFDANPEDLILEITESKLMGEFSMVLNILTSLRLRRINLSIDDFGTGHSSMLQLRDIPCTELKLDRSYVHDAYQNNTLFALLDGSMKTAKNLGINSVAEGIENLQDWNCVRECGCDYGQGYFIAKPMPLDSLNSWHTDWVKANPTVV